MGTIRAPHLRTLITMNSILENEINLDSNLREFIN